MARLHDPGAAARAHDETVARLFERQAPLRQPVREIARVLVERDHSTALRLRLSAAAQIGAPRLRSGQPQQGALRHLAAVHARRSEEDDGVLDVLLAESSERAEVPERMRIGLASVLSRNCRS